MGDQRGAYALAVEDFDTEKDDFETWVKRFESAVKLAHNIDADADALNKLCIQWLPLKLGKEALSVYSNVTPTAPNTPLTWEEIKTQLTNLLINPQDKYNWRSRRKRITWDGQENFHALAARVKRTIDRYEDGPSEADYYHEFRSAYHGTTSKPST